MLLELQVNSQNVHNTQWSKFFKKKSSKFLKCYKIQIMSNHNPKILIHMIQNDAIISKDFKLVLNPYDAIWYNHINLCQTCLDIFWCFYENGRTKRKMQGRHKKLFLGSLRASRAIKNLVTLEWRGKRNTLFFGPSNVSE